MIGQLRGEILLKQAPLLVVDVNGVGYELEAPMSTFYHLPECGQKVLLHTHLLIRDDAHMLYGFYAPTERALFRLLLKVSGIGAKMALAILSGMDVDGFRACVRMGDADTLVKVPGIGKKTAERLIIELRDRLEDDSSAGKANAAHRTPLHTASNDPMDEAVAALVALGYKATEAQRMVNKSGSEGQSSEEIIRSALRASMG